jgi:hypothetical protein
MEYMPLPTVSISPRVRGLGYAAMAEELEELVRLFELAGPERATQLSVNRSIIPVCTEGADFPRTGPSVREAALPGDGGAERATNSDRT